MQVVAVFRDNGDVKICILQIYGSKPGLMVSYNAKFWFTIRWSTKRLGWRLEPLEELCRFNQRRSSADLNPQKSSGDMGPQRNFGDMEPWVELYRLAATQDL
ncbi:hypothetical protein CHARACLAT_033576 [Characodon lateralis]|uniref:Uncharacterized protein n=1 Tax=Characodon lateralis TaxID=208331 RepID=A0ABU7EGU6_9TELE|nr:hypothetical protein [Characodon lateralis]